jgi:hypothetical protein
MLAFSLAFALSAPRSAQAVLEILVNESGSVSLSADGAGSLDATTTIQVEKPNANATVRSAFLSCASLSGRIINDGDVSLDDNPVDFNTSVIAQGPFAFNNVFGEVTAIVKPTVDAASPGLVSIQQSEVTSGSIDGCALYVIFDDPGVADRTVFILFGTQTPTGDAFDVTLAEPLDPIEDTAEMGLAISFSFQGDMVSLLDVNGTRLTSSAGGQDDGSANDGALITVGGIGDTNDNPPPLVELPTSTRFDDELYNLLPFVEPGVTSIRINTRNPSNDDNIFAGHMVFSGIGIFDEGILLAPQAASNFVGTSDAITATVVDDGGIPVAGRLVDFSVGSGPNAGQASDPGQGECAPNNDCTTGDAGEVTWTYTSNGIAGTDTITATFTTSQGAQETSEPATKSWLANSEAPLVVDPIEGDENPITEINNALLAPSGGISILAKSEVFVGRVGDGEDRDTAQSATYVDFNVVSGLNVPTPSLVLPNGVLLTSGNANILNTNTSEDFQGVTETGGDAEAAAILAANELSSDVSDVNSYSFEFTVPAGNDAISANFLFGSEEFPNTPFTDFFFFIVDGVNYATFEDGSLVSFQQGINQDNFNDNDFNNPAPNYPIEYDGLSNVLLAVGQLNPKISTHTLKIIVGDTGDVKGSDPNLDSAVFIGGLRACEAGVNCENAGAVDNNDPLCDSLSVDGPQAFGFATDNLADEDDNTNGFLDPGEDANENGMLDFDSGVATVALVGESSNLTVNFEEGFEVGDAAASFVVDLISPNAPGDGTVSVTDVAGNVCVFDNIVIDAICVPDVACDTGLLGVCAAGVTACSEEGILTCDATTGPGELPEVCDSEDNDCDGAVDEELDVETTCGAGLCVASGVIACVEGTEQPDTCQPIEGVVAETTCGVGLCAGSGVISCVEGTEQPDTCQPVEGPLQQTVCGTGRCESTGLLACEDGILQPDTCEPVAGVIEQTSCGTGLCAASGVIACVEGTEQPDTCEPVEGVIEQTSCGTGVCAAAGVIACADGSEQPDTCEPIDGVIAETTCGVGECASFGVIACEGGTEQGDSCVAGDPGPEVCDTLDNNCNDAIDECCPDSDASTEGCPVCSDLLLVEGSEIEYMGTATDTVGISLIFAPSESNLSVMPAFDPGASTADFTVGIDELNSPAGGVVAAVDTDGLVCFFDPVDFPTAAGGGTTPNWAEGVRLAGDVAYVLDETDGLSIFGPANAGSSGHELLHVLQASATDCPNGVFYDDLDVRGETIIIAGGICGLILIDTSGESEVPGAPAVIATLATMGEAEDAVFGSDGRVYVADFFRGLVVVDASNTREPRIIHPVEAEFSAVLGEPSLPLVGSPVALVTDEERNLLYLATTQGLYIIDTATAGFPVIGAYEANPDDGASPQERNARTPQDVVVAGDVAYLSVAQAGLLIIDVSNPRNPQPIGDPVTTVQIFYKLSISESRLFVAEGSCGVAVFQIVGTELREVLGSPFALEGSAIDCSNPSVSDTFAWSLDEQTGRVVVGTGILSPGSGGFEFIDFTESLVPEPDRQLMFAVAIASLVALRRRGNAAGRRRRR